MKTLELRVKNNIGILEKLSMVFTRNRVNVEKVELHPLENTCDSKIILQFHATDEMSGRLLTQLLRIVEVKSGEKK